MEKTIKKPKAKVVGKDGNVYNLIGICSKALKKAGMTAEEKEMITKVFSAGSYDEALMIMSTYCELH